MRANDPNLPHLRQIAQALGDLREQVVFVGGAVAGLLVNELFEGDLSDDDKLVYVNQVLKGKLMESELLTQQARSNTKAQFAASPNLDAELMEAIMAAFEAHQSMSRQALESERVRAGMKSILLGPAGLYESLRDERPLP